MKWAIRTCLAMAALLVALLVGLVVPIPAQASEEKSCLAEAMYYEARDQGWRGMLAVGIVVQNRVRDDRYPDTVCGVVRHKCQFSYYCDGKPERPAEKEPWSVALDLATMLLSNRVLITGLEDVTHYHATWVKPSWAPFMEKKKQIGGHVFYAQRGGTK